MNEISRKKIEELFHRYGAGVSRYVLLRVGSPELAEEITARVFLNVVRNFQQQNGAVVGWLWAIIRSELSRHFRQHSHLAYPADLASSLPTPSELLERQERDELLHAALKQLSDDAQQILSLKFFLDVSNVEIAQTLGLTPSNVGVKLHRALRELRELLQNPLAMDSRASF